MRGMESPSVSEITRRSAFDQLEVCARSTRSARCHVSTIRSMFPSCFQESHIPQDGRHVRESRPVHLFENREGALEARNGLGIELASIVSRSGFADRAAGGRKRLRRVLRLTPTAFSVIDGAEQFWRMSRTGDSSNTSRHNSLTHNAVTESRSRWRASICHARARNAPPSAREPTCRSCRSVRSSR